MRKIIDDVVCRSCLKTAAAYIMNMPFSSETMVLTKDPKHEETVNIFFDIMRQMAKSLIFVTINDSKRFKGKSQIIIQTQIGEVLLFAEGYHDLP